MIVFKIKHQRVYSANTKSYLLLMIEAFFLFRVLTVIVGRFSLKSLITFSAHLPEDKHHICKFSKRSYNSNILILSSSESGMPSVGLLDLLEIVLFDDDGADMISSDEGVDVIVGNFSNRRRFR